MKRNNKEIDKLDNIFNNIKNNKQSIIEGIINIDNEDINKDIILYNSEDDIDIFINNERRINENKYKFNKIGQYKFKLLFKNKTTKLTQFFKNCLQLYSINLYNYNTLIWVGYLMDVRN